MASISKGLTAHKVKVVSWSNRNRKSWRKKGKSGGSLTPPNVGACSQDSQLSVLTKDGAEEATSPTQAGPTLGPREVQEANALIDQLKKLLSQ